MKNIATIAIAVLISTLLQQSRPIPAQPVAPAPSPLPETPAARTCPVFGGNCKCDCVNLGPCSCAFQTWYDKAHEIHAAKRDCVVFVGVKPREVPGFECVQDDGTHFGASGVVVGVWRGDFFERLNLPATASDAEIQATIRRFRTVQPVQYQSAPAVSCRH